VPNSSRSRPVLPPLSIMETTALMRMSAFISQAGQQGILAAAAADGDHMNRLFFRFRSFVLHGFPLMPANWFRGTCFIHRVHCVFQSPVLESVVAGDAFGDNQFFPFSVPSASTRASCPATLFLKMNGHGDSAGTM
jgi:hypothetical protein